MLKRPFQFLTGFVLVFGLSVVAIEAKETKAGKGPLPPIDCFLPNAETPILLAQQTCPGQHTCITTACGVMSDQVYCCPMGYRYLNHCDCNCYTSTDFNCNSYTRCD